MTSRLKLLALAAISLPLDKSPELRSGQASGFLCLKLLHYTFDDCEVAADDRIASFLFRQTDSLRLAVVGKGPPVLCGQLMLLGFFWRLLRALLARRQRSFRPDLGELLSLPVDRRAVCADFSLL